jgi:hypothetical protein
LQPQMASELPPPGPQIPLTLAFLTFIDHLAITIVALTTLLAMVGLITLVNIGQNRTNPSSGNKDSGRTQNEPQPEGGPLTAVIEGETGGKGGHTQWENYERAQRFLSQIYSKCLHNGPEPLAQSSFTKYSLM